MKKILTVLGMVFLLAASVAVAAEVVHQAAETKTYSWRYKTTVEVETPEGLKTGSAVREVDVKLIYRPDPGSSHQYVVRKTLKGEAVVVDLGKRGVLFALLKGTFLGEDYAELLPYYVFPKQFDNVVESAEYYSHLKNAKSVLDPVRYPILVTFTDLHDPKTVKPVMEIACRSTQGYCPQQDYYIKADHLEELFGKGVKLKAITIEMTDAPVTRTIEKYLPSFGEETGFWKWFKALRYGDPRRISPSNFR